MAETLDVSRLPTARALGTHGPEGQMIMLFHRARVVIKECQGLGLFKSTEGFGFAMARPRLALDEARVPWDDPYQLAWFVSGWGPDRERYIANALRKMRAAMRNQSSTLDAVRHARPGDFRDVVASQEPDGSFAWGDFPHGGAVFVDFNGYELLGSVSALTPEEDHAAAAMILQLVGLQLSKLGYTPD